MLFVHGFGTDQRVWQALAVHFAADFRLVLLDNVGAGQSDPAAFVQHHYLNLHAYAADLLEVCAALELRDAILVGHSVGAMIGVLAALQQPERFARLVLIGASPRYLNDGDYHGGFTRADLDRTYSAVSRDREAWADHYAPLMMGSSGRPELGIHFAEGIKSIPARHVLTVLCSIFQSDHRADVARLRQPTLLIQAREDPAVPAEVAEFLHGQIHDSRLAVIPVSGHLPHVSAPDQVLEVMTDFVRAPASGGAG